MKLFLNFKTQAIKILLPNYWLVALSVRQRLPHGPDAEWVRMSKLPTWNELTSWVWSCCIWNFVNLFDIHSWNIKCLPMWKAVFLALWSASYSRYRRTVYHSMGIGCICISSPNAQRQYSKVTRMKKKEEEIPIFSCSMSKVARSSLNSNKSVIS